MSDIGRADQLLIEGPGDQRFSVPKWRNWQTR